jgi:hypothetical protein
MSRWFKEQDIRRLIIVISAGVLVLALLMAGFR